MDENKDLCPCCGRHCDLSAPGCERGEEYLRTGVIPERKGHGGHEDHHGGHDHEGPHGRHCHGERGGDGYRGEHPRHGRRGEHKVITERKRYQALDTDGKLLALIHESGHTAHFLFDGKGSQNRILHILAKEGAMTQRTLTEHLGIQPGSASEVIGKLEKAGFISRVTSDEDRRTADIRLTDAGKAQAEEQAAKRKEKLREMFSALTEEEKVSLLKILEKLNISWTDMR